MITSEHIKRIPVVSSNIVSIGYDDITNVLQVEFKNGKTYNVCYPDKTFFDDFMKSTSKGTFYWKYIRNNSQYNVYQIFPNVARQSGIITSLKNKFKSLKFPWDIS